MPHRLGYSTSENGAPLSLSNENDLNQSNADLVETDFDAELSRPSPTPGIASQASLKEADQGLHVIHSFPSNPSFPSKTLHISLAHQPANYTPSPVDNNLPEPIPHHEALALEDKVILPARSSSSSPYAPLLADKHPSNAVISAASVDPPHFSPYDRHKADQINILYHNPVSSPRPDPFWPQDVSPSNILNTNQNSDLSNTPGIGTSTSLSSENNRIGVYSSDLNSTSPRDEQREELANNHLQEAAPRGQLLWLKVIENDNQAIQQVINLGETIEVRYA